MLGLDIIWVIIIIITVDFIDPFPEGGFDFIVKKV